MPSRRSSPPGTISNSRRWSHPTGRGGRRCATACAARVAPPARSARTAGPRPARATRAGAVRRMDDVVGEARMIGIAREERIENGDRPALLGEGGVGARCRGELGQCVVDRDLHVARGVPIQALHGVGVRLEPGGIGCRVRVAVERGRGGDESALSRRRGRQRRGPLAAATPLASAGPDGPPANGLPQALSARPQYAIAQVLSAASTAPNARSPSSHQNECSTAIACSKRCRALACRRRETPLGRAGRRRAGARAPAHSGARAVPGCENGGEQCCALVHRGMFQGRAAVLLRDHRIRRQRRRRWIPELPGEPYAIYLSGTHREVMSALGFLPAIR